MGDTLLAEFQKRSRTWAKKRRRGFQGRGVPRRGKGRGATWLGLGPGLEKEAGPGLEREAGPDHRTVQRPWCGS